MSSQPIVKPYSIAWRLTVSLLATVSIVAWCAAAAFYYQSNAQIEGELRKQADNLIGHLSGVLSIPLWDLNTQMVAAIGDTMMQNDLVATLIIKDRSGEIVYATRQQRGMVWTERTRPIQYQGEIIGEVHLMVTKQAAQHTQRATLRALMLTTVLILLSLGLVTGVLIRIFLRQPLQRLNEIIKAYAAKQYDESGSSLPYLEFQPFGNVLAQMGDTIRRQMQTLQEQATHYRVLVENLPDIIIRFDRQLRHLYVNRAVEQVSSLKAEDVIGKRPHELGFSPERVAYWEQCLQKVFTTGQPLTSQFEFDGTSGNMIFDWRLVPECDAEGHIVTVLSIARDITERKRAEERIKNQNLLLEQSVQQKQREMEGLFERLLRQEKLATIGQMAGSIAHELRNPLGAVKQSVYYLKQLAQKQELIASNPKVHRHLELMDAELNTSERVIADLLDMTRMKPPQGQPTDFGALAAEAVQRCCLPQRVCVTIALDPEPFFIYADPVQLRQVLLNVLTNAAQAIEGNGLITISAKQLTKDRESVIEIKDTGIGVEPDALSRVFDPLYTTKATGTGLGLSICKQMIESHQGRISLTSQKGQGATVTIVLPRND